MSNENKTVVSGGGIGFCGVLCIAFIVLKLCGVINWSWIWVLAPIWVPTLFVLSLVVIICIFAILMKSITK
jgi:hypothetical protein